MLIHKSFKFELLPDDEQTAMLQKHGGNLRFAWNTLLEFANNQREINKKFPTKNELRAQLKIIQQENKFLKVSHSQPIQNASDKLFDTFVKAIKPEMIKKRNQKIAKAHTEKEEIKRNKKLAKALNFGFPKFKKKSDFHDSIFYPQFFKIFKKSIFFPKIGKINFKKHRQIEGKPKFLTITQDGYKWFVSITSEIELIQKAKVELKDANIVGIDVGIKTFATLSDGTEIQNPRTLKKYLRKLKLEQRKLSRKQLIETEEIKHNKKVKVSSKRREKQIEKVLKIHRKVKNVRKDFLHKTANQIITKFDGIVLETLNIQNMLQINGFAMNRNILDVSWFKFSEILDYKSLWNNKYFTKIDMYDPSTQECSNCHKLQHLSLKERVYVCPHCGFKCGRDINSAYNIKNSGMKIFEAKSRASVTAPVTFEAKYNKNTTSTVGINDLIPLSGIKSCNNARGENSEEFSVKREKLEFPELKKVQA